MKLMYTCLFTVLLLLTSEINLCIAQNIPSSIEVKVSKRTDPYFTHTVIPKQTLYGISKLYQVSVKDLKTINGLRSNDLKLGQRLTIPLVSEMLYFKAQSNHDLKAYVPLVYQVKKRENLFKICRQYFDLPISIMKEINELKGNNLSIGQSLILGWVYFGKEQKAAELITESPDVYKDQNILSELTDEAELLEQVVVVDQEENRLEGFKITGEDTGLAIWDKNMPKGLGMYVLHKTAPINSWIELENPMFNRYTRVKVIGKIPTDMYDGDPLVIISPDIAKLLNVLDGRFYVKVRYLQAETIQTSTH